MRHRRNLAPTLAVVACLSACTSGTGERETLAGERVIAPAPIHPPVAAPLPSFQGTAYQEAAVVQLPKVDPEEHPDLHNVFKLSDEIISGSEPHGEEAFRILQSMGIHTILSVDGKVPNAELASKYGMKYVHLPIQYRGITDDEVAKIAKTFREQKGPFYVHCFHGKHRGPAAAEIGRLVLDGVSRETAIAEMRQWCGTAESYEGLYSAIAHAEIPDEDATMALDWEFPSAHPLDGIAGAMVLISRADDNMKALSKNDWQIDPHHPDVDALNEAQKLAGVFERSVALDEVASEPADFRQWMQDAKEQSAALRDAIEAMKLSAGAAEGVEQAYKTLSKTCTACHVAYRN